GSRQDLALKLISTLLSKHGMTALVTGGNHEGYDEWEKIEPDARGIRWVRKNIGLLPRGYRAVSPAGTVVASLGGANSIDKPWRVAKRGGWWAQEQITEADLKALGRDPVDVLLAHDAPRASTLVDRLARNKWMWDEDGLAYAEAGQRMFH